MAKSKPKLTPQITNIYQIILSNDTNKLRTILARLNKRLNKNPQYKARLKRTCFTHISYSFEYNFATLLDDINDTDHDKNDAFIFESLKDPFDAHVRNLTSMMNELGVIKCARKGTRGTDRAMISKIIKIYTKCYCRNILNIINMIILANVSADRVIKLITWIEEKYVPFLRLTFIKKLGQKYIFLAFSTTKEKIIQLANIYDAITKPKILDIITNIAALDLNNELEMINGKYYSNGPVLLFTTLMSNINCMKKTNSIVAITQILATTLELWETYINTIIVNTEDKRKEVMFEWVIASVNNCTKMVEFLDTFLKKVGGEFVNDDILFHINNVIALISSLNSLSLTILTDAIFLDLNELFKMYESRVKYVIGMIKNEKYDGIRNVEDTGYFVEQPDSMLSIVMATLDDYYYNDIKRYINNSDDFDKLVRLCFVRIVSIVSDIKQRVANDSTNISAFGNAIMFDINVINKYFSGLLPNHVDYVNQALMCLVNNVDDDNKK